MSPSTKYDDCKRWPDRRSKLRYRLRRAAARGSGNKGDVITKVWVSDFGFHHTVFLDTHGRAQRPLDEDLRRYLERKLQHNSARFEHQVALVREFAGRLPGLRVLDIGCGGGLFLSKLREAGADV